MKTYESPDYFRLDCHLSDEERLEIERLTGIETVYTK